MAAGCQVRFTDSPAAAFSRRSKWQSSVCDARSFGSGYRWPARSDNQLSRRALLRTPPSSATVCPAAGDRRMMSSWHGCARALDGPKKEWFRTAQNLKSDQVIACFAMRTIAPVALALPSSASAEAWGYCSGCSRARAEPSHAKWWVPFGRALYQRGEAAAFIAFCWLVPTPPGGLE